METLKTELVEDGTKRDRRGRRLMAPERIDALVREYEVSGLTQAAFARRAGLKYPTFAGWVWARRAKTTRQPSRVNGMRFAQLQLPAASAPLAVTELSVTLADGTVVRGVDAQAVAALVRALRS